MSMTEADRHEIYELIKQHSSDRIVNNVMSMFPSVGWADVATKTDLAALRSEFRGGMSEVRSEVGRIDARIVRLDSRLDVMRSDLLSEVHQSVRNQTWALIAWTTGLAGLIVALGRFV